MGDSWMTKAIKWYVCSQKKTKLMPRTESLAMLIMKPTRKSRQMDLGLLI
jgi:hypothetical protein